MTLPRTAAQVLSGHVRLEVRCIDRMLLTFRQPRLQYGQGIHGFFCHHRGNQFVSSALMRPMTERFAADIRHYIDVRGLDLVRFAKGQSKDQVARGYLAGHDGGEQILFAGVAQEKTRIWRTRQRTDAVTGKRYPWLCQEQAMVNHWYFYGFDADFGPFYLKFCGYFPYTGQIYLNGHEYAKRQCLKAGIGFTALDNAFGAVSDPAAVQRICDGCCRPRCLHMVRQQFLLMKRQRSVSLNPKAGSPGAGACPWGQIDVTRGPARIRPGAAVWPACRRQGGRDPSKRPGRRARGTLMRMAISAPPHMAFANRHGPRSGEAG